MKSFSFGDLFQYGGQDYIFLAETEDTLFAAKILDKELTRKLKQRVEKNIANNTYDSNLTIYSFVELQTEDLKERVAHFARTGDESFSRVIFEPLGVELCVEDLRNIKEEIASKRVPNKLKELIEDIEV